MQVTAIAESIPAADSSAIPDLEALAQLLYLTAGITRHRKYPSGDIHFRAAACTGALYEVELYVVCGDLVDLEAGVYHFSPAEFALRRLRAGDYRSVLSEATASETSVVHAPLTIIVHARTGAMRGNIRPELIATLAGITALC